eukprot:TRINITY_DN6976_c0_g1_i1.p1 TRINITY_DN6976_c0_g1~~TRINITY_DN6976_c0_g1_i1.p1  ORF type:complete len:933 (+),score=278.37 TRINITY_DN6976_c0_g1_i1:67-2799(+)
MQPPAAAAVLRVLRRQLGEEEADPDLAEYLAHLAAECPRLSDFRERLFEADPSFPVSAVDAAHAAAAAAAARCPAAEDAPPGKRMAAGGGRPLSAASSKRPRTEGAGAPRPAAAAPRAGGSATPGTGAGAEAEAEAGRFLQRELGGIAREAALRRPAGGGASVLGGPLDVPELPDTGCDHWELEAGGARMPRFLLGRPLARAPLPQLRPGGPPGGQPMSQLGPAAAALLRQEIQAQGGGLRPPPAHPPASGRGGQPAARGSEALPVSRLKQELLSAVAASRVLIVEGETGSGKTTQIPQFLVDGGFATPASGLVVTQPRRVAAVAAARRVAAERGVRLGEEVGYAVRFDECIGPQTRLRFVTDGVLLREALHRPELGRYRVVIVDEAHERSLATDLLLALLRRLSASRPELRVLISSATLDCQRFSEFFGGAPVLSVPGRTHPVEVLYARQPVTHYAEEAVATALSLCEQEASGDVLVFLTGQEEIDWACRQLAARWRPSGAAPEPYALPLYAALPQDRIRAAFAPAPDGHRKVVFATNIAEASVTIDGVVHVVDSGFTKLGCWDAPTGVDSLQIVPVSKAGARQRAGRAGRTRPGVCYRLFTEQAFDNELPEQTPPEICRVDLTGSIIALKEMGLEPSEVQFVDPPEPGALAAGLLAAFRLGALDDAGDLTPLGRRLAAFPLEPRLARVLLAAESGGAAQCADAAAVLGLLQGPQPVFTGARGEADAARRRLASPLGDHCTLLRVYNGWAAAGGPRGGADWAREHHVSLGALRAAHDAKGQLLRLLRLPPAPPAAADADLPAREAGLLQCFVAGCFERAARCAAQANTYHALGDGAAMGIHPSSVLWRAEAPPAWVIYHEAVRTTRDWMQHVSRVHPSWLLGAGCGYYRRSDPQGVAEARLAGRQAAAR